MLMLLTMLAEAEPEERTNITPVLLKFGGKFLAIFAIVALVTVLTPRIAKWVDDFREKHRRPEAPEDPRCKAVKGPYDMPEPVKKRPAQQRKPRRRPDDREGGAYRPKHAKRRRKQQNPDKKA
ncbi:MAG: hypothetical protein IJ060_09505 [Oscillospiraceae bacterium]|nr:hypothetical protein [Oscillospiraceae bacterium]